MALIFEVDASAAQAGWKIQGGAPDAEAPRPQEEVPVPRPAAEAAEAQQGPEPDPEPVKRGRPRKPRSKGDAGFIEMLGDLFEDRFVKREELDKDALRRLVMDTARETLEIAKPVKVVLPDGSEKRVKGLVHQTFETVLKSVAAGIPIWLTGPAGSGKTQAASQVAEALGFRFFCLSLCSQTTQSSLLGYQDANSNYVRTLFREAYEHGGVILFDEMDNGNANIMAVVNAALANGHCAFPDGMIEMHQDFRCIAAANTWGSGRTIEYVGRNPIDAATLDRFVQIDWGYDEKLERMIAGDAEWTSFVQAVRKVVSEKSIKHLVTPRASIHGSRLIAAGMDHKTVASIAIFKGLDQTTRTAILAGTKQAMGESAPAFLATLV